ncbi:MAG: ABC transporter permease, partial [Actinomycetota bacterium]|nr:ABC transporter permease [Actinomycetota bacterium]
SIPARLWEHVQMCAFALGIGALIALPVGLLAGHRPKGGFVAITIGNLGRALPSFGILAIVFPLTLRYVDVGSLGFLATLITLVLLAIPPIMLNTFVGTREVDRDTVEAARGMGLSGRQILVRIELPLAAPLIVAGLRTAATAVVATATLGAFASWGGLGRFIVDGLSQGENGQLVAGAFLVALLAVLSEAGFALLQKAVAPRTSERKKMSRFDAKSVPVGS